jgi:hypothetical protein
MMIEVENIAKRNNIYKIKLSALGHVILYYEHLGYSLERGTTRIKKLLDLFKSVVKTNKLNIDDEYIESFSDWLKSKKPEAGKSLGFDEMNKLLQSTINPLNKPLEINNNVLNQKTQKKLNKLDNGVPMIKYLERTPPRRSRTPPRRSRTPPRGSRRSRRRSRTERF